MYVKYRKAVVIFMFLELEDLVLNLIFLFS